MSVRLREKVEDPPSGPNAFVGRQRELDQIITLLLGSTRLITLIGSGGIGKTRLASEAMRRYQKSTHAPVYWVRLARLGKGAEVAAIEQELARAVIGPDFSGRSGWQAMLDTFAGSDRGRQAVLVLDNCEHVLDGVGELVAKLLDAAPRLSILATSRAAIGWVDEQRVPLPPLSEPQALTLFRQRSELTGRPVVGDEQAADVRLICRHVHNHPLYIRLAAARLVRQPLPMILRELSGAADDKRMRWSDGPRVGAEPRHRAVRDVIAWSYDLCAPKERVLFERMSVFATGYDSEDLDIGAELAAIEFVCAGGTSVVLDRAEIEGLLDRLVDQSLVCVHITATTVRYSLLESLRVFAQERLSDRSSGENDEPARMVKRHSRYYRDAVLRAADRWFSPAEQEVMEWARGAWDNILTAIDQSITAGPAEAVVGLEICTGLVALRLPFFKISFREIRSMSERSLAATRTLTPQPTALRARTTSGVVWIALCQGKRDEAEAMLEECVRVSVSAADYRPDWRQTAAIDTGLPAPVEFAWGLELLFARSDSVSVTVLNRAIEKFRQLDDAGAAAMSEMFAVFAVALFGASRQAHAHAESYHDRVLAAGAPWSISWAKLARSVALALHGKPAEALTVGRDALAFQLEIRDQWGGLWSVQYRMWALAQIITELRESGRPDRGRMVELATETAQLASGAANLRAKLGVDLAQLGPFATETEKAIDVARSVLGPAAFAVAEAQGAQLDPENDEVQRLALGTLRIRRPQSARAGGWSDLTSAETEVATLAAAGWTNTAIAVRRGSSSKTVDAQVAAILQKLAITSRAHIIDHLPDSLTARLHTESAHRPNRR